MKKLLFILSCLVLTSCKVIYTPDDVYYSHPNNHRVVVTNNTPSNWNRPYYRHPHPVRPHTRVIVITPRKTNLETYRRPNQNPKHK